jgi:biotin carboxyl carrier protein
MIENLRLTTAPLKAETSWKTIQISGMIVDRPGRSDRGIVTPIAGVVTDIRYFPGETVPPGATIFTLQVLSEPLHQTQTELFKAVQDIKLNKKQRALLERSTSVSESSLTALDNQIARLEIAEMAGRQELRTRGLTPAQIESVAGGKFVSEIAIVAPQRLIAGGSPFALVTTGADGALQQPPAFEVQEVKVEPGQKVEAGQTLCVLSNHQMLAIRGRAFRDETPLLERTVRERWPVEVDFLEGQAADREAMAFFAAAVAFANCPSGPLVLASSLSAGASEGRLPPLQQFLIGNLANTIDPVHRTFDFIIPLDNQCKVVQRPGATHLLWRYRPGQIVRLHVRVEKLDNVFVLPIEAVVRDGIEAFVFTQNVNTFERKPVRILLQERQRVVVANDGSFPIGTYVAQNAAAQLNRMAKAQTSTVPKGYHVHADGSLHKNEDEGK